MNEQSKMTDEETVTVEDGGSGGAHLSETSRRELEEEFNVQRAKMKELFLQKEEDMRNMVVEREQLQSEVLGLRAALQQLQTLSENQKSEIQSLQLLVSETVEASSSGTEEVRRLRARNMDLEQQLTQLRQQQEMSLAPATFVRSLARKLGADTDQEQPAKKNVEDNELLHSIIQPLEMEITALKNKLRETDAQLQEALKAKATNTTNTTSASVTGSSGDAKQEQETTKQCDMCANYERQLVSEQGRADAAREKAKQLEQALKLVEGVERSSGGESRRVESGGVGRERGAAARLRAGGAHAGLLGGSPLSLLQGIIPGTKWCGTGDIAADYHDLGADRSLDRCCRTHDLCPTKVRAFSRRYNLTNNSLYSKSHCTCDDMLFECLKNTNTSASHLMGHIYFNLVQVPCLEDQPTGRKFRDAKQGF